MRIWVLAVMALALAGCYFGSPPGNMHSSSQGQEASLEAVAPGRGATSVAATQPAPWARTQGEVHSLPTVRGGKSRTNNAQPPAAPSLKVISRGDLTVPTVALTFDDGPHPEFTPRILRILATHKVRATFFVVGKMALAHPALVLAEHCSGHAVGNHTYNHFDLSQMAPEQVYQEWWTGAAALESVTGVAPRFCRPPGGNRNSTVVRSANTLGMTVVMWSDYAADSARPASADILRRALAKAGNGSIILLHDGIPETLEVLPDLIVGLKRKGFAFQTVAEMARHLQTQEVNF